MAHVLLLPVGSHGDVHPFVALGTGLRARGHRVTMITAEPFRGVAERNGLDFVPTLTRDEYDAVMLHPDLWHPKKGLRVVFDEPLIRKYLPVALGLIRERYVRGETVAVGGSLALAARTAHDALGIPYASVTLQPMTCCSVADPPVHSTGSDFTWLPSPLIRAAYWTAERFLTDPMIAPPLNDFRRSLGLAPVSRILTRWIPSPQADLGLFPDWFGPVPDMPPTFRHCGFVPFDDAGGRPTPAEVNAFFAAGPPPVVFSFGSAMRTGRPYFEAAVEACVRLNVRGVLLARAGDQIPASLPPNVIHAPYAPFSDVFPRSAVVVHHGGIGTSAQALRAGVPQLVMPLAFDQADNAARMKRLGVSRTLFPHRFRGKNVARTLRTVMADAETVTAAKRVSAFAGFDGVARACEIIESLPGRDQPPGET
jgi:rhamnosyltransferase subunit B